MSLQVKDNEVYVPVRGYAMLCHNGQKYGYQFYMCHLDAVAQCCSDDFDWGDVFRWDEAIKVAYLHDAKEDYKFYDREYVERMAGENVVKAIDDISKVVGESYEDYIAKVKSNPLSLFVKKCDTMCNLRQSIKDNDKRRIKKYLKQLELLTE